LGLFVARFECHEKESVSGNPEVGFSENALVFDFGVCFRGVLLAVVVIEVDGDDASSLLALLFFLVLNRFDEDFRVELFRKLKKWLEDEDIFFPGLLI